MAEFREHHPVPYCVLAAAVGLAGMLLVYRLWECGVGAGALAGIDTTLPRLGPTLVKLVPAVVALALLRATGRAGLLSRTSGFGRGILAACGLSGLIFGLMHLVNLIEAPASSVVPQVVSAAFAGVLLAAVYFRSGNIWANAALHMVYDMGGALGVLFKTSADAGAGVDAASAQALSFVMPMVLGLILGCVALFLLRKSKVPQVREAWADVVECSAARDLTLGVCGR